MRPMLLAAMLLLMAAAPASAEPKTCSEANEACLKPFGRICDAGCQATCRLRFNGCLKTGAYSTPGKLYQNLRRQ
jgi:hypothetical protein